MKLTIFYFILSASCTPFPDNLMLQNESINGHHKNAKFMCADVTSPDLKIEDQSMDLIFSNWLLMYLSDKEVAVLF